MRPCHKNGRNFDPNGNHRRGNSDKSQNDRAAILALDSEYNYQLKVVAFLYLIRLSHFEPSLALAVRQSGEARNASNRYSY